MVIPIDLKYLEIASQYTGLKGQTLCGRFPFNFLSNPHVFTSYNTLIIILINLFGNVLLLWTGICLAVNIFMGQCHQWN